jgi:hypothetical protein
MTDINVDELGPVDYLVVSFPADRADFSGVMASELKALIGSRTIRLLDLLVLTKGIDGPVEAFELRELGDSEVGELRALEANPAVLLAESDIEQIGESLQPRQRGCGHGLGEQLGGAVRLGRATVGRRAVDQRPDPDPGARRGGRSEPPGHPRRSLRWVCSKTGKIDRACSAAAATCARTAATTAVTGVKTAATVARVPACSASLTAPVGA